MKDRQVKEFSSSLFKKRKTPKSLERKQAIARERAEGRIIPLGKDYRNYKDFRSQTYSLEYKKSGAGVFGRFIVRYNPELKMLAVSLPVFFYDPSWGHNPKFSMMQPKEVELFKRTIHETWSRKYQFFTIIQSDNIGMNIWRQQLNNVSVVVNVIECSNSAEAFYRIKTTNENILSRPIGKGEAGAKAITGYDIPQRAYNMTRLSERPVNPRYPNNPRFNQYAYIAGQMFGLGNENSMDSELKSLNKAEIAGFGKSKRKLKSLNKPHITIFDPSTQKSQVVTYGQVFKIRDKYFIIYEGTINETNSIGTSLLEISIDDPMIAGCIGTSTYDLSRFFIGKIYARNNSTFGISSNVRNHSLMAGGREVKKHHYVNFLDALVKSIQMVYTEENPKSKRGCAPNTIWDWKIID
ncbi:hypothetical protein LJC52_02820 [Bacteroidales bacterium OttesenSCG-928-A17]|nr:hypothetical protein [Bacteroidales bacterium OttesenSCG-928-A17]